MRMVRGIPIRAMKFMLTRAATSAKGRVTTAVIERTVARVKSTEIEREIRRCSTRRRRSVSITVIRRKMIRMIEK